MARTLLGKEIERQASLRTYRAIENKLRKINTKSIGLVAIKSSVSSATSALDIDAVYADSFNLYSSLASSGTLDDILKYYNNKGLVQNVCSIFELGRNGYEKLVLRMLNSSDREQVISGLQQYVPSI
jgi:hypothetical protein